PCGNCSPVGEQVIKAHDRALKIVTHLLRSNQDFLVFRADVLGNAAGVGTLVEIRMDKAHRECAHLRLAGGKRRDQARIESSRKQQADRYVGNQMLRGYLVECGMEFLLDITRLNTSVTCDFRVEVALELWFLVRPHTQEVSWRQLMHTVQDGTPFLERVPEF